MYVSRPPGACQARQNKFERRSGLVEIWLWWTSALIVEMDQRAHRPEVLSGEPLDHRDGERTDLALTRDAAAQSEEIERLRALEHHVVAQVVPLQGGELAQPRGGRGGGLFSAVGSSPWPLLKLELRRQPLLTSAGTDRQRAGDLVAIRDAVSDAMMIMFGAYLFRLTLCGSLRIAQATPHPTDDRDFGRHGDWGARWRTVEELLDNSHWRGCRHDGFLVRDPVSRHHKEDNELMGARLPCLLPAWRHQK
jgi:hypothetical protein